MQPIFEALTFELMSLDLFCSLGRRKTAKQKHSLKKHEIPQGYWIKPEVKIVLITSSNLCISLFFSPFTYRSHIITRWKVSRSWIRKLKCDVFFKQWKPHIFALFLILQVEGCQKHQKRMHYLFKCQICFMLVISIVQDRECDTCLLACLLEGAEHSLFTVTQLED